MNDNRSGIEKYGINIEIGKYYVSRNRMISKATKNDNNEEYPFKLTNLAGMVLLCKENGEIYNPNNTLNRFEIISNNPFAFRVIFREF